MDNKKLIESLSPNERKIIPHLNESISEICKKSILDKISVIRSLEYLQNKKIIELSSHTKKIIEIGVNGALYKKKGLPERRLLNLLSEKRIVAIQDAPKESSLSPDEFKASLGALKKKALVELKNGKIFLNASPTEIAKKSLEELFIESLPLEFQDLTPEQQFALKGLQQRKEIVQIEEKKKIEIKITELGKTLMNANLKNQDYIESITPKLLQSEKNWKGKQFRRYDLTSPVPAISGGKRHFVNQAIDYGRKIWTEMGFKEMTGNMIVSSFWNFDALFTAQDHPVREMHDTFFLSNLKKGKLPDKKIVTAIKKAHETGTTGSKGWRYKWDENESKKMLIRTHTTCLSAQTLSKLKEEDLPAKFFAIGWNFRNETLDWSHGFELLQTEGIVVDPNANFQHLLGYLKQFAQKMGFEKVRFRPAYFPYTEPSIEGDVWNEEKQEWVEYLAAGMFRPEVSEALMGKPVPILAWGPGFGRMLMQYFKVKDLREFNENNLTKLRKKKFWI
ncbi:phenylalanine--tRNA ligase subunit alpha [archaeon]|jgi:phenylalanyl-tRNA synthetase alpha chain|nr:phenylalanine--tRNA ligase subunit alpha [archaeon]MBT4373718.1 phenylalanine--tRNA ligase subunit alpha [archaeon]MBT4531772.1 phenylalanine--tRNA ligase subunit alpha [archaeon]MBT7001884.1 phenylalanine--tRNA ligase subunit alpha [archaeon]MBT7281869.1 phenylalanine--tRNA ligase subunit alpha [archaeon]